jgi:hypothetical protein
MYAPRRHTRRLLLPPGWVALGFLLLLGCQALLAHRQQISVYHKLELAMPIPEKMAAQYPSYDAIRQFSNLLSYIKSETQWGSVNFNGKKLNDFISDAMTVNAVQAMRADTAHARGVRIYFRLGATYDNLVAVLDLMDRLGHPIYWLDIEHSPTVFYVVNKQAFEDAKQEGEEVSRPALDYYCVRPEKYEPLIQIPSSWQIAQQNFTNLWQQPWQLIAILIATLAALTFYRLARPRPSIR